ncbi:Flagellin [compost metagenome]
MAQVINTNSLSLMTQNNMNASQSSLNSAIQRLSSGLRINSAKDDAAGQAIANRFTSNIRGLTQAQRNANDGISLAQTTEGALTEVNNNLQRIRELSVQAATGSNSASDLKSIQDEIKQRLDEIDRTSQQTDFNGVKVLSSNAKPLTVQVGANDGETITINLKEISSKTLGLSGFSVARSQPKVGDAVEEVGGSAALKKVDLSAVEGAAGLNVAAGSTSLHRVLDPTTGAATSQYVVKSGDDMYAVDVADATGAVTLSKTANTITYQDGTLNAAAAAYNIKVAADASGNAVGYITIQGHNFETTSLTNNTATMTDIDGAGTDGVALVLGKSAEYKGTASNNPKALLDSALKIVDDLRSSLGAVQNRFDSVISNLGTTITNLSSSRSRIQDADYATEVSNMTRGNILQQAGTSVLAQANQTTQGVLSLLR